MVLNSQSPRNITVKAELQATAKYIVQILIIIMPATQDYHCFFLVFKILLPAPDLLDHLPGHWTELIKMVHWPMTKAEQ